MLEGLEEIRSIDNHCHMYGIRTENPLERFTLTGNPANVKNTMAYYHAISELAKLFSCRPELGEILKARRDKMTNFKQYVSFLFENAGIGTLIVEPTVYPKVNMDEFRDVAPGVNVHFTIRTDEAIYDDLLNKSSTFDELVEGHASALDDAYKTGVVAFKCVIGYYTGLHIKRVDESDAEESFKTFKKEPDKKKYMVYMPFFGTWQYKGPKRLRDFLFWKTIEKCIETNLPMQIHTADSDITMKNMSIANPVLLHHVLTDDRAQKVNIVLLHAGYPFVAQSSFLTNFPNIYLDTSYIDLYTTLGLTNRLVEILEIAPFTKILYGSDAFGSPEMHWLGTKLTKKALREIFTKAIQDGILGESQALEIVEMMLSGNAKKIYPI